MLLQIVLTNKTNKCMPDNAKDVAIAILGASVGLAGLLLVFSGLLFSQAAAFPKDTTPDDVIDRFRGAGRIALWPFLLCLLTGGFITATRQRIWQGSKML